MTDLLTYELRRMHGRFTFFRHVCTTENMFGCCCFSHSTGENYLNLQGGQSRWSFAEQGSIGHGCQSYSWHRARSLRNLLVSGNECGRVFPAGVGPGSPSRDAANWLPSRFSLSVETRRRYGWLRMMVFPGARLFPSPNLVPFGRVAARERQGALSRRAW